MTTLALLLLATSNNQFTPGFPGGIVAWIVCNRRKREPMGGWLLFYYWQLYSGVLLTALFFVMSFQNYVPENFVEPRRYWLLIAGTVPTIILFAVQVAVATMMVSVRTWEMVRLLRTVMILELIASCLGAVVDAQVFPDNLPADAMVIAPQLIWLCYWFVSRRVRHVFEAHDWDEAVKGIYPLAGARLLT